MKTNYRPVSLSVSLSKVCEKVDFLDVYNFLNNTGFSIVFSQVFDQVIPQLCN